MMDTNEDKDDPKATQEAKKEPPAPTPPKGQPTGKKGDQSLKSGSALDATMDSGYNGSGDGSRDNTSSGRDSGRGTDSAMGSVSVIGSGSRVGSGSGMGRGTESGSRVGRGYGTGSGSRVGSGMGSGDGKCYAPPVSRGEERRESASVSDPSLLQAPTRVPTRAGSPALVKFKEASSVWTNECAVSIAVTTTDSGISSMYKNKGQGSVETSHPSVWLPSEHQSMATDSDIEDGARDGSQQEGSQDRKRSNLSQFHYSPLKKRKKSELWYYDKGGSGFSVAVSLADGLIIHVTDSIMQVLGYPKDFWPGQMFMNFVHKKDLVIFNNLLTDCNTGPAYDKNGEARSGHFYCRLRAFPGLKSSYSMSSKPSFRPFYIKYRVKNVILQGKDVSPEEVLPRKCMTMIAQPLSSPFRRGIAGGGNFRFTTHQSVFGNLEEIDTNGICTLGCLPQDIVGTCIFYHWHEEDLRKAISTFQKLIECGGTCHSDNYRLSTNNGHYITVQTEWKLLLNKYSNNIELVQGTHRLLGGPSNVNVFSGRSRDISERHQRLALQVQNAVKEILIQYKMKDVSIRESTSPNRSSSAQISDSSDSPEGSEDSSKEFKSASANIPVKEPVEPPAPVQILQEEPLATETNFPTWGSYQQLNYAHNIRRFLQSRPRMYATERLLKNDEKRGDGTQIVVVAPPFQAGSSSAVVHVSEHLSDGGGDAAADYEYTDEATVNDQDYSKEGSGSGNGSGNDSGTKGHSDVSGEPSCENLKCNLTQELMKIHNNVQEQIYLQQMKNSMGKDAYHPLVAYPYPTTTSQCASVLPGNTEGSVKDLTPMSKEMSQSLDNVPDTENICIKETVQFTKGDFQSFKQHLLSKLKPLLEKKRDTKRTSAEGQQPNAYESVIETCSSSIITSCNTVSSTISFSPTPLSSSRVMGSGTPFPSMLYTSPQHNILPSQIHPSAPSGIGLVNLPFNHEANVKTQPVAPLNIPMTAQAMHPALKLVGPEGLFYQVDGGRFLSLAPKPKMETVATQTFHSTANSKRSESDGIAIDRVSSLEEYTGGDDGGSDDTFSVSLSSAESTKNGSANVERRIPFWLNGIVDISQLITYTMDSFSSLNDTEEALKEVTQPNGLANQLQELVVDINKEKTIMLYQPLIYLEDDIARLEVDATGRGVSAYRDDPQQLEENGEDKAEKSSQCDDGFIKRPLSPSQPSTVENEWKGKRPMCPSRYVHFKGKSKFSELRSKRSDVVSILDKKKSEWCHEKRTPLTELDILNHMMCRVHVNFPFQSLEDADFPWHCNCDVEASAYVPLEDTEDRISDRMSPNAGGCDDVVDPDLDARIENTLMRDQRLLRTFIQPRGVLEQMKESGIRSLLWAPDGIGEQSNSDLDFFDSVD